MWNITDPVTLWAVDILILLVAGICLLIAAAFIRRWQQIRYTRYVHTLKRQYRPVLARVLAGEQNPCEIEALRHLSPRELEVLLDPVFSKRVLPERCVSFLRTACADVGLIDRWQSRAANGSSLASPPARKEDGGDAGRAALVKYPLRAKSIRNLGSLRHRQSWPVLVKALDDPDPEIQFVALRALAGLGAPESFPALRERLHAVVLGTALSPPLPGLQAALVSFGLDCVPALLPSLCHENRSIRLHATEILRTMVCREAAPQRAGRPLLWSCFPSPLWNWCLPSSRLTSVRKFGRARRRSWFFLPTRAPRRCCATFCSIPNGSYACAPCEPSPTYAKPPPPCTWIFANACATPTGGCARPPSRPSFPWAEEGRHQLYEYFLTSQDRTTCEQIVEVIERTGLMSELVEEYSAGTKGVDALMVEQLASDAAPLGLSGILRTLSPEIRQKFLDRFLPFAEARLRSSGRRHKRRWRAPAARNMFSNFPPVLGGLKEMTGHDHLRSFLDGWVTAFNLVVLSYFFLGNGIYTILMLLSLRATWVHMRRMTYQGLDALRHSPLTPPVTIVIPAWNEQDVIVEFRSLRFAGGLPPAPGHRGG